MPRDRLALAAVLLGVAAVGGRLGQLALVEGGELRASAVRQRQRTAELPARPGDLLDRHGRLLATTVTADSLFVVPRELPADRLDAACAALAAAAGTDPAGLNDRVRRNRDGWFAWVRRRLDPAAADRVRAAAALELPAAAWGFRPEFRRRTPLGAVGGSLVGLRDLAGDGVSGLERALDDRLRGVPGVRTTLRDARGRPRAVLRGRSRPPASGDDVTLTIDAAVQRFAEAELDRLEGSFAPVWCCLLVTDPKTGEILAAASRPAFDPNDPAGAPPAAWTHHAFGTAFEPGSTVKPLFVGAALADGAVAPDERIDCEGGRWWMPNGRALRDVSRRGLLTPADILVHSSNIGTAKIAARLGPVRLHAAAAAFGFGRPTGAEMPSESPGLLRPLGEWTDYSPASVAIGHEFTATAVQLAAAHGALANGGRLLRPTLVRGGANAAESRVLPGDWAAWLVAGPLTGVVDRGTARGVRTGGLALFGKTGTAQLWDEEAGRYSDDRTVASAVIGGPSKAPRALAVCVAYDPRGETRGGGSVAAPAAAAAVRFALRRGAAGEDGE